MEKNKEYRCMTCDYMIDPEIDAYFHKSEDRFWCMGCIVLGRVFHD